ALIAALKRGAIRGALLDVTDPEPLPADHELWNLANVLITPHTGGWTNRYTERIWPILLENLGHYHAGDSMRNRIDFTLGY
ncbi:MAG: D-2-hydroxyacid dehydrogenase, partial [Spirochaetales bacterium]